MLWKIYNIQSGKILKAGFADEDLAKEWMEVRDHLSLEDYIIEEMDHDEEEEWLENNESEEEPTSAAAVEVDEEEEVEVEEAFGDDYFDGGDLDDEFGASIYEDEEEAEDE